MPMIPDISDSAFFKTSFLNGKRVLITGALGGIGRYLVRIFHDHGAHVILSGLDASKLEEERKNYPRASILEMNLGQQECIQPSIDRCLAEGPIHILINNGGITQDNLAMRITDEQWNRVLQINLTSGFQLCRAVYKNMIKERWGRMINMSSVVGFTGNAGQANYAASKAGLVGLTKTLALEMAKRNVTVNAIAPGFIDTNMTQHLPQETKERIPCQRYGTPEEIAFAALFLAHPLAGYITGQTLHVNGGMAMF
jgi:3-oxoacyl-[acyl-carrier protein] reductase